MEDFFLGSMAGLFEGGISYEWEDIDHMDPMVMGNRIEQMSGRLSDMTAPMMGARQILIDDIQQNFDTESAPDKVPWAEWSPSYAKVAKSSQKLRLSDELYDAATDPNNYPIIEEGPNADDLFVNPANFPPYWAVHQRGGHAGKGGGSLIPARPYIGFSEQGAFEVLDLFEGWVAGQIDFFVSGSARVHFRGEHGQIGPMVTGGHGFGYTGPMMMGGTAFSESQISSAEGEMLP